jgi:hypothetical protein
MSLVQSLVNSSRLDGDIPLSMDIFSLFSVSTASIDVVIASTDVSNPCCVAFSIDVSMVMTGGGPGSGPPPVGARDKFSLMQQHNWSRALFASPTSSAVTSCTFPVATRHARSKP